MRIGAIILAAGEAKRFGGNKLTAEIDGKPIIRKVIEASEGLDRVIIVGKYYQELLRILEDEIVIYNPLWREGISTSLKLGVRFFQDYDGVIVLLGDMPLVSKETVNKLTSSFSAECDMVVPIYNGARGNPVILNKRTYGLIMELKGDVGARQLLGKVKKVCYIECGKEVVIDVDTPSDLASVKRP